METLQLRECSVATRTAVEMGDNPHLQLLHFHLVEVHGLDPEEDILTYQNQMDNHRGALVEGEITIEDLG